MRRTQGECSLPGRTSRFAHDEVRETLDEVGDDADGEPATVSGSTAPSGTADGDTTSNTPFFGVDSASGDIGASTEGGTVITTDDAPSNTSSNEERDIGSVPTFGATGDDLQIPKEREQSPSAKRATTAIQDDHNNDSDTQSTSSGGAIESSGEQSRPKHVSYDIDAEGYVCDLCGSEYPKHEKRKANACCQFASKDDVFAAVRRARDTAETSSELFPRLGSITEHAEEYGIEVMIQDFTSLDESSDEPTAASNGGTGASSEREQDQNPATSDSTRFREATTDIPDDTLRSKV